MGLSWQLKQAQWFQFRTTAQFSTVSGLDIAKAHSRNRGGIVRSGLKDIYGIACKEFSLYAWL